MLNFACWKFLKQKISKYLRKDPYMPIINHLTNQAFIHEESLMKI